MTPDAQPGTSDAAEARQAVHDLQRYFSDEIAPMMAMDAVETLLQYPASLAATSVQGWVAGQYRGAAAGASVSDCIYHALKKFHLMAELELVDAARIEGFLADLKPACLEFCPEAERTGLAESLDRLGEATDAATTAPVEMLHRRAARPGAEGAAAQTGSAGGERGVERFGPLLERLLRELPGGSGGVGADPGLLGQAVSSAALSATNGPELERYLARLKNAGVDPAMAEVFRSLGSNLPGWALLADGADGVSKVENRSIRAMHRIVSMAPDPSEGASRLGEMIATAVEQLNDGRLAQAVSMIALAERIVAERSLPGEIVEQVRSREQDRLSADALRTHAENPAKHPLLRTVLEFFPAYRPAALLDALHDDGHGERRKLVLALLEAHGPAARAHVLERLTASVAGDLDDDDGWYRRNLLNLLRRLDRPGDEDVDLEVELVAGLLVPGTPMPVLKEAVAHLGQIRTERSAKALIEVLGAFESMAIDGSDPGYGPEDVPVLLDRLCAALARVGTRSATRTIVNHAYRNEAALGSPLARLESLGATDLSGDRELVDSLVQTLRNLLPRKVLGFVPKKHFPQIEAVVQGLAGSPAPLVRTALGEIVERFGDEQIGEVAARVLTGFDAARARPAEDAAAPADAAQGLSGDLELFGLPNLLQTLSEPSMSGVLTLAERDGRVAATLRLAGGRVLACEVGAHRGESAFYQMFESPVPATFTFRREPPPEGTTDGIDILGSILEGLRRHDELQLVRAVARDGARYRATGKKPTVPGDETDRDLLRGAWSKAAVGTPPDVLEAEAAVDAYRVRRLYAHWIEEGALA